jgi:hypothetical protein
MMSVVPTGLSAGTTIGVLELDYEVDFYVPRLAASTTESSTELKFPTPTAGATPILPAGSSAAATHVVDATVTRLKSTAGVAITGAIQSAVRNYVSPYTGGGLRYDGLTSSYTGWPPGNYTIRFYVASNTLPGGEEPTTYFGTTVRPYSGVTYLEYTSPSTFSPTVATANNWTAFDGVVWNYMEYFDVGFGVIGDSALGWSDFTAACFYSTLPSDLTLYATIALSGSGIFSTYPTTGAPFSTAKCTIPTPSPPARRRRLHVDVELELEGKEEKKKLEVEPPPVKKKTWDEPDPSPPPMRPPPTAAPGGSRYVSKATRTGAGDDW